MDSEGESNPGKFWFIKINSVVQSPPGGKQSAFSPSAKN
jgi:hypothetical protein